MVSVKAPSCHRKWFRLSTFADQLSLPVCLSAWLPVCLPVWLSLSDAVAFHVALLDRYASANDDYTTPKSYSSLARLRLTSVGGFPSCLALLHLPPRPTGRTLARHHRVPLHRRPQNQRDPLPGRSKAAAPAGPLHTLACRGYLTQPSDAGKHVARRRAAAAGGGGGGHSSVGPGTQGRGNDQHASDGTRHRRRCGRQQPHLREA